MKRRLLIIAVFLLLGAVVNVAVAWGCALWSSATKVSIRGAIHDRGGFGYTERGILTRLEIGGRRIPINPPPFSSPSYGQITPSRAMAGWPRRCFIRENTPSPPRPFGRGPIVLPQIITLDEPLPRPVLAAASAGIELPSTLLPFKVKPNRRIPTQILWSGFAQNVLVFAVILGLGIRGPVALRRFLRLRRGLCPKCAYPMGESAVCTECGDPLPRRRRVPIPAVKRRLLIIALFLLAGAVVNVGVAWGCAAFAELDKQASFFVTAFVAERPGSSSVPFFVMVHRRSGFGLDQVAYPPTEVGEGRRAGVQHTRPDLPRWALWPRELVDQTILYVAAGWPLKAVVGHGVQGRKVSLGHRTPPVWKGAYIIEDKVIDVLLIGPNQQMIPLAGYRLSPPNTPFGRLTPIPARVLPWRPLPLRFAFNTLFYATLLWLLIPGPFALRRFLRLRRGLCPKCAYPRGEAAVCTECGKPLPS